MARGNKDLRALLEDKATLTVRLGEVRQAFVRIWQKRKASERALAELNIVISRLKQQPSKSRSKAKLDTSHYKQLLICRGLVAAVYASTCQQYSQIERELTATQVEHRSLKQACRAERARIKRVRRQVGYELATQAGVPEEYRNNVHVTRELGVTNIYFGGSDGKPQGENHGHYAMYDSGEIKYLRPPGRPHGKQNFVNQKE